MGVGPSGGRRVGTRVDLKEDFSESKDLAARHPAKLAEPQRLWWRGAEAYGVLPLDGRSPLDLAQDRPGQPWLASRRSSVRFYPGQKHLPTVAAPHVANRPFSISARVDRPDAAGEGMILAHGAHNGSYVLYVKAGRLVFDFNDL